MENKSILIGEIKHPIHGKYYLFYSKENNTYGLSRTEYNGQWCGYSSISELFKIKGL